jgi:MFS family permease
VARTVGFLGDLVHWHWYCFGKNSRINLSLRALTCHSSPQAYWIDFGFSFIEGPASWRTPIAIQLIFAVAVVFIVWGLPESPRWLAKRGRMEEALEVICAVNDLPEDDPYVVSEMESIRQVLALEQNEQAKSWTSVFKKDILQTRKRVGLAWFGLFMNQLSGINLGTYWELSQDHTRNRC